MTTLAAQITETGISAPDYADILQELRIMFWTIYGADSDLDDDTQDGQFLSIFAKAIYDCNQTAIAVYNSFSPATAQGVGLSQVIKINGMSRNIPTNSQADVDIVGQVGTRIENGVIGDNLGLGTQWSLPPLVVIPNTGTITVTATSLTIGSVRAATGTLTNILTPTRGWQTVTNPVAAVEGEPIETDPEVRVRQSRSVALPAITILESIYASVAALTGVVRLKAYENDTDSTNDDTLPPHSISLVINGGDVAQIAQTIALEKSPGTSTYGSTSTVVFDQNGVPSTIKFWQLLEVPIAVHIFIKPLVGYVSTTGDLLITSVSEFIDTLDIGEDSYLARLYTPSNLNGTGLGATFVVTAITQSRDGDVLTAADVIIAFNEAAVHGDIQLTLV